MGAQVIHLGELGYRNAALCAKAAIVHGMGVPVDEASFNRVAELIGDCSADVLADGFVVCGMNELQHLCKIGNFVVATPPDEPDGSPIRCYLVSEWAKLQGELQ